MIIPRFHRRVSSLSVTLLFFLAIHLSSSENVLSRSTSSIIRIPHFRFLQKEGNLSQQEKGNNNYIESNRNSTNFTPIENKIFPGIMDGNISEWKLLSTRQWISSCHRKLFKMGGETIALWGMISSLSGSSSLSPVKLYLQWKKQKLDIQEYLQESGINKELEETFTEKMFPYLKRFCRKQLESWERHDLRESVLLQKTNLLNNNDIVSLTSYKLPSMKEAARYIKFATAAYGDSMIRGVRFGRMATCGKRKLLWYLFSPASTRERAGEHCGIPTEDIIRMDYSPHDDRCCHFVAIDHAFKAVVLSIRGTFTLSDLVIDANGFSKPYCGGEAHSHMASMAKSTWEVSQGCIEKALEQHPDYSLVLTGHSLGAGVASLIHLLVPRHRKTKCLLFGCPPVFTPPELLPQIIVDSTTCYMHGHDIIPFLSISSIRKLVQTLQLMKKMKEKGKKTSWWHMNTNIFTQRLFSIPFQFMEEKPTEEVPSIIDNNIDIIPKKGSPQSMVIPASTIIWTAKMGNNNLFDYKLCDPRKLFKLGIPMTQYSLSDHSLAIYEEALHALAEEEKKKITQNST